MKILAKIPRLHKDRSELVEMDLFDTERNPLVFPSGTEPIMTKNGSIGIGSGTTNPPWDPFPWSYYLGLPISDPSSELVADATVSTDPTAIKLVKDGSYLIGMQAVMNLDWVGGTPPFTYAMRPSLRVFRYADGRTLGRATDRVVYDTDTGGQSVILQTLWQGDLNAEDEIGAELRIDSNVGAPAGGDPWFYPDEGLENPPIIGRLTRLGDYAPIFEGGGS